MHYLLLMVNVFVIQVSPKPSDLIKSGQAPVMVGVREHWSPTLQSPLLSL